MGLYFILCAQLLTSVSFGLILLEAESDWTNLLAQTGTLQSKHEL